jgi:hypothetical protein
MAASQETPTPALSRWEREKGTRVRVLPEKNYPCEPGEGAKREGRRKDAIKE